MVAVATSTTGDYAPGASSDLHFGPGGRRRDLAFCCASRACQRRPPGPHPDPDATDRNNSPRSVLSSAGWRQSVPIHQLARSRASSRYRMGCSLLCQPERRHGAHAPNHRVAVRAPRANRRSELSLFPPLLGIQLCAKGGCPKRIHPPDAASSARNGWCCPDVPRNFDRSSRGQASRSRSPLDRQMHCNRLTLPPLRAYVSNSAGSCRGVSTTYPGLQSGLPGRNHCCRLSRLVAPFVRSPRRTKRNILSNLVFWIDSAHCRSHLPAANPATPFASVINEARVRFSSSCREGSGILKTGRPRRLRG